MKRSFFQAAVASILLIWMHYMDSNKTAGEEARRQLHKNAASNLEQVLAATPHKTPTVRPPASYHENYSSYTNQTCRTLLEKQGRTHKRCTLVDPHTWPCKNRTTSTNIHSATMWGYGMLSWRPAWGDERYGKVAREGQGYPRYQHDMMMMMMIDVLSLASWRTCYRYSFDFDCFSFFGPNNPTKIWWYSHLDFENAIS